MKKIIVFAGYSKISYLHKVKQSLINEDFRFVCVIERTALTEGKLNYLSEFDEVIDLRETTGVEKLVSLIDDIACVTCTQERDMLTYIKTLHLTKQITEEQKDKYLSVINKQTFKEGISKKHQDLVPQVFEVNEDLLENLENLNYPLVIKPTGLAGSTMVRVVNNSTELKEHIKEFAPEIRRIASETYNKEVNIIAEEFIAGPQYSVNVYIDKEGQVTFCPIIRVVSPLELGINDTYSALQYNTNELADDQLQDLKDSVKTIIKHFSIKKTSAHFDSVLTDNGWKFFEVGLRIGGNRQSLFEKSHCFDHVVNDVLNRLDRPLYLPKQLKTVCIVQKTAITKGFLRSIRYNRHITKPSTPLIAEKRLKKIDEPVAPLCLGGGTITRHFVIGKEEAEVIAVSRELFENIKLEIE